MTTLSINAISGLRIFNRLGGIVEYLISLASFLVTGPLLFTAYIIFSFWNADAIMQSYVMSVDRLTSRVSRALDVGMLIRDTCSATRFEDSSHAGIGSSGLVDWSAVHCPMDYGVVGSRAEELIRTLTPTGLNALVDLVVEDKWTDSDHDFYSWGGVLITVLFLYLESKNLPRRMMWQRLGICCMLLFCAEQLVLYRLLPASRTHDSTDHVRSQAKLLATSSWAVVKHVIPVLVSGICLGRIFFMLSLPVAWASLESVAVFGGRKSDAVFIFAAAMISSLVLVALSLLSMEIWVAYILCLLLLIALLHRLVFAPGDWCDSRMVAQSIDVFFALYIKKLRISVSGDSSRAASQRMDVEALKLLPDITNILIVVAVATMAFIAEIPLVLLIAHPVALFLVSPWPELLGIPMTGSDQLGLVALLPGGRWQTRLGGHALRFLVPWNQRRGEIFIGGVRNIPWKRILLMPAIVLGMYPKSGEQSPRRFSGGAHSWRTTEREQVQFLHKMYEDDLVTATRKLTPPFIAHLFPVTRALSLLRWSLVLNPLHKFSHPSDVSTLVSLQTVLVQATYHSLMRVKIFANPDFVDIFSMLLEDLHRQMEFGTKLAPTQREYVLTPVAPACDATLPLQAIGRHLECMTYFMQLLVTLLSNSKSGDPDDYGTAVFQLHIMKRTLRALIAHLPLMFELVVWCEGPGEVYAAPALEAELNSDGHLRIEGVGNANPIRGLWMSIRGHLAEVAFKILRLIDSGDIKDTIAADATVITSWRGRVDNSASSMRSEWLSSPLTPPSSQTEEQQHQDLLSDWLKAPNRVLSLFTRISYCLHKRYFRMDVPAKASSQFMELLAALAERIAANSGGSPTAHEAAADGSPMATFVNTKFEEDAMHCGLRVMNAPSLRDDPAAFLDMEQRLPLALQSCNGKHVLFYCALVAMRGIVDSSHTNSNLLHESVVMQTIHRHMRMIEFLARQRVPFVSEGVVPMLCKVLSNAMAGLKSLRQHILTSFYSPQHGGNFAGDVYFLEEYYRSLIAASVLGGRSVASIVRALEAYSVFVPSSILRLEIASVMESIPLKPDDVNSILDVASKFSPSDNTTGEVPVLVNNTATKAYQKSLLYRMHKLQVAMWQHSIVASWSQRSQFREAINRVVGMSANLRERLIQSFQFPAGVVRTSAERLKQLSADDSGVECVVCLESIAAKHHADDDESQQSVSVSKHVSGVMEISTCGHLFHAHCIFLWLCGGHSACPVCRREMSGV